MIIGGKSLFARKKKWQDVDVQNIFRILIQLASTGVILDTQRYIIIVGTCYPSDRKKNLIQQRDTSNFLKCLIAFHGH